MNWLEKARRFWPWLAAAGSGLLCAGCFAPFNQAWLCWICLGPLLAAIWFSGDRSRHRWLRSLLLGYVAGLAFFWTAFFWVTTVTIPGWFLLQFYMATYFAFWGWFCGLLRPRTETAQPAAAESAPPASKKWSEMLTAAGAPPPAPSSPWVRSTNNLRLAFLLASAWVTHEWLRGWVFTGWDWNSLGIALHRNWLIIQIAEFTGVAGLSFTVAFANVIAVTTVRRLILEARFRVMRPHYDVTLTMSAVVGLLAFGWHVAQSPQPARPLRVAAVQAEHSATGKIRSAVHSEDFR